MDRFLDSAMERLDSTIRGFSALAEEAALAYPWPGNVRELRNRVERAVVLAGNEWIMPGDLFPEQFGKSTTEDFLPLAIARDAAEKRQIVRALDRSGGQLTKAATLLGISRTTLWEKMTRFSITGSWRSES
jgi:DNA-binding NtrC family response regulator